MTETPPATPPDDTARTERGRTQNSTDRHRIAANVRAELARAGMPTAQVADLLHLHRNTTNDRLAGRSAFFAYEIARLAAALDVPVSRLLDGFDLTVMPARGAGPGVIGPQS